MLARDSPEFDGRIRGAREPHSPPNTPKKQEGSYPARPLYTRPHTPRGAGRNRRPAWFCQRPPANARNLGGNRYLAGDYLHEIISDLENTIMSDLETQDKRGGLRTS